VNHDPFDISADYGAQAQVRLEEVISQASPRRTGLVIRKVLENLVLAERAAHEKGFEITDSDRRRIMQSQYPEVQAEVDRAVGVFIGSIVSAEGG
jgi:hypothetical protein